MNSGRFFLPRFSPQFSPLVRANYLPFYNKTGVFSRIFSSIRNFNWNGLLNGANKTLNVVNQTIPLVRQAGPMVNNMKNMLKIARAFGNETTISRNSNSRTNKQIVKDSISVTNNDSNDNYPNFFV